LSKQLSLNSSAPYAIQPEARTNDTPVPALSGRLAIARYVSEARSRLGKKQVWDLSQTERSEESGKETKEIPSARRRPARSCRKPIEQPAFGCRAGGQRSAP